MLYSLSYSFSDHSHQQKEKMIFSNRINFEGHFVTVNKNIASDKINARGIRTLTTLYLQFRRYYNSGIHRYNDWK